MVKSPLGPRVGAVNVPSTPGTGFFSASVTVTARWIGKRDPTRVAWLTPTPVVSLVGFPARPAGSAPVGASALVAAPQAVAALPSTLVSENATEPYAERAVMREAPSR